MANARRPNATYIPLTGVGGWPQNANFSQKMPKYTNMLVYFALGDVKVWRWGSKPTPVPNANGFASQWYIGLNLCREDCCILWFYL